MYSGNTFGCLQSLQELGHGGRMLAALKRELPAEPTATILRHTRANGERIGGTRRSRC